MKAQVQVPKFLAENGNGKSTTLFLLFCTQYNQILPSDFSEKSRPDILRALQTFVNKCLLEGEFVSQFQGKCFLLKSRTL